MLEVLREELTSEWTPLLLVLIGIAGWCAPASIRRSARWIGVAIVGSVCWRALHPVPHAYLSLPRHLFLFLAIAPCVAWLCHARRIGGTEQLLVVALILYEAVPQMPHTFRPRESLQALKPLWRGELPVYVPTGCESGFGQGDARAYRWDDYRATVDYLRRNTSPQTYVANMLRQFPFPALNGPAGRLDPFPYESGIGWIWMVRQDLDSHFANALARISDVVVVWVPDERVDKRMRLTDLTALVRCKFALSARFGRIEVWRRK
jgi:hypothetical protein